MGDKKIILNEETGQPIVAAICSARIAERNIDELIGLCKGIMADGSIVQAEADFLLKWMESNQSAAHQWPANILYSRIEGYLSDGILDDSEKEELFTLLKQITGGNNITDMVQSMATTLPLDTPPPIIEFEKRIFCLTGAFTVGSRDKVTKLIESKGGKCVKAPTLSTDYLVIGIIGSRDWIHSTHGRKIETAMEWRDTGEVQISIVSEEHWIKFV
ncbi:BRCT domain-containing protein [Sulfuricurvum sp.]|uniref:BRCT domain-containing protein n=1 Tax=Sulfuricurvum sp. TaxID=2025608 RepID=UPI003BB05F86